MELLNVHRAVGDGEANGILVMNFDVFNVERKSSEGAAENPLAWGTERAAQVERTCDRGVSGEFAMKIRKPERIKIELIHFERKVGRITIAQLNVAVDQQ